MIAFQCGKCQKQFTVPDSYAGRRARCKGCGDELRVPAADAAAPDMAAAESPITPQSESSPIVSPPLNDPLLNRPPLRIRRLMADAESMRKAFDTHPHIRIESAVGDPPELYRIAFTVNGLARDGKGRPKPASDHMAEVQLGADYPRLPPVCRMITPVFHPNIDESHVCIGDHWTAGERLIDLVARIAEMIGYQAYNIRSPLDGEAAMWADLNADKLPIDPRPFAAVSKV